MSATTHILKPSLAHLCSTSPKIVASSIPLSWRPSWPNLVGLRKAAQEFAAPALHVQILGAADHLRRTSWICPGRFPDLLRYGRGGPTHQGNGQGLTAGIGHGRETRRQGQSFGWEVMGNLVMRGDGKQQDPKNLRVGPISVNHIGYIVFQTVLPTLAQKCS